MATQDQITKLRKGAHTWNVWRTEKSSIRPNLHGADLHGADLGGADLSEADLGGANLSEADLSVANLRGADLRGADLRGADLRAVDLSAADLGGANLHEANLRGADLSAVDLRATKLGGTNLSGANLRGANLRGVGVSEANLQGADLRGADLRGANLRKVDLRGANLSKVDLHGVNLSGANLRGVGLSWIDLRATKLDGADLSAAYLPGTDLSKVDLRRADLRGANLRRADLRKADLRGNDLGGADLREANLSAANLRWTDLRGTVLRGANLSAVDLRTTKLGENLSAVDLSGANLSGKDLSEANLSAANLSGANLRGVSLRLANLVDTRLDYAHLTEAQLWETQRSGWSIKDIICQRAFWDREGKQLTEYEEGEFELLFAEKLRIVLHYPGIVSPIDLIALPIVVARLEAEHPGSMLQIRSMQKDAGGASVIITVEDTDSRDTETFGLEIARIRTQLEYVIEERDFLRHLLFPTYSNAMSKIADAMNKLAEISALPRQEIHYHQPHGQVEGPAMSKDIHYKVTGQAGVVGPNAHAHDMSFQQIQSGIDLPKLAEELGRLRAAMKGEATGTREQDKAIGAVTEAEDAAAKGDGIAVLRYLKGAGTWTLRIAQKIGLALVVEVLKKRM